MADQTERDAILDNIEETLSAIKQGEVYNYTPAKVTREALPFDTIDLFPTYMVLDGPEGRDYFGKRVVNYFTILIRCIHFSERGKDYSEKINKMIKDVSYALVQDVERGGNASNTTIPETQTDEGWLVPKISCEITVRCDYLTLELNR